MSIVETLANIGIEKDTMQREPLGVTMAYMLFTDGYLKARFINFTMEEREYNSSNQVLILDNPTYDTLDNHNLGDDSTYPSFGDWHSIGDWNFSKKITLVGQEEFLKFLNNENSNPPSYIAWGTGDSQYLNSQTNLDSETGRKNCNEITILNDGNYNYEVDYKIYLTTIEENNVSMREFGLFNASSGGTMFFRFVLSSQYLKDSSKETRITIKLKATNSLPITNTGRSILLDWFGGNEITIPSYIAWGSGSTAITENDTSLENEVIRNQLDLRQRKATFEEMESVLSTSQANSNTISRIALFDSNSGGNMWMIKDIAPIDKTSNIQIQTTFRLGIN